MRFGNLPGWAIELSDSIEEAVVLGHTVEDSLSDAENESSMSMSPVLPWDLLSRQPLFDQLIVNSYQPGEVR